MPSKTASGQPQHTVFTLVRFMESVHNLGNHNIRNNDDLLIVDCKKEDLFNILERQPVSHPGPLF